jgi:hypothetical protein
MTNAAWTILRTGSKKSDTKSKLRFQTIVFLLAVIISAGFYSIEILDIQMHVKTKRSTVENFRSPPYADWIPTKNNSNESGVTIYRPKLCSHGLNLYATRGQEEAHLIDMKGNIVHTWSKEIQDSRDWAPIEIYEKGDLLALVGHHHILRLDRSCNILWKKESRFHHELEVDEKGNIWSLLNNDRIVRTSYGPLSILDNSIAVLSQDGHIIREIPLYEIFEPLIPKKTYMHIIFHIPLRYPGMIRSWLKKRFFFNGHMKLDIFHANSLTILDRDIEGVCKKGDILICVRELDTIVILSQQSEKMIWEWGSGELDKPHHATLLDNGNILLFDNGLSRGFSRVIEVNPLSRKIEWEYKAQPPEMFFSATRGACQRLPNDNTLITESNNGRVFEVTKKGETVWEFYMPTASKKKGIQRATLYRMTRITDEEKLF